MRHLSIGKKTYVRPKHNICHKERSDGSERLFFDLELEPLGTTDECRHSKGEDRVGGGGEGGGRCSTLAWI